MSQPAPERDASHVLTLEEISKLAAEGGKPAETLMNVVALIAKRFQTDVCSAYLLEPDRANLVLAATVGLRPQCIGTLRLGLHEGLAGLVAEQVGPVAVAGAKPSAVQIFQGGGGRALSIVSGRAADRPRRAARRAGGADRRSRAYSARKRSACWRKPRRKSRRWSARRARSTVSSRRLRSGSGRWRAICGGVGITIPPACFAIWIRCAGGS